MIAPLARDSPSQRIKPPHVGMSPGAHPITELLVCAPPVVVLLGLFSPQALDRRHRCVHVHLASMQAVCSAGVASEAPNASRETPQLRAHAKLHNASNVPATVDHSAWLTCSCCEEAQGCQDCGRKRQHRVRSVPG